MIRAVSLDVGGTLVRAHPSVGQVYARACRRFGLIVAPTTIDAAFRQAWRRRNREARVRVAGRDWWRHIVDDVLASVGFTGDADGCFEACYEAFARPNAWRIHDDVVPALEDLAAAGFRLGVLSNWDERLPELLDGLGLSRHFEWRIVSALESVQKPDPAIFARVCKVSGLLPSAILHVGDHPAEDVAAAGRAGMASVRIDRQAPGCGDGVINDLRRLIPYLQGLNRRRVDR